MNTKISDAAVEAAQRALYFAASPDATEADYIRDSQDEPDDAEDVREWTRAALAAALPHLAADAVPVAVAAGISQFGVLECNLLPGGLEQLQASGGEAKLYLHPQPAALNEVSGNSGELGGDALLREVSEQLDAVGCGACTGSMAPLEDLHGRISEHLAATGKQQGWEVQGDALLESLVTRWRNDADELGTYDNTLCQKIANCTMRHAAELQAVIAARQPVGQEPVVPHREALILIHQAYNAGRKNTGYTYQVDALDEAIIDAPPAQGIDLGPIATRKLSELAAQGYVTNGVAIFNPATGQRGLVDNLGFVGWMGGKRVNDRESCSKCDNGIAINSSFRTEEACRHCQKSESIKVAEVVKNSAGQVYIEWIGGMVIDHAGSSLYKFSRGKE